MKPISSNPVLRLAAVATFVALASTPGAHAQGRGPTAVYNEAVKVIDGVRHVQLPPLSNDDRVKFSVSLPPEKKTAETPQQAWLQGIKWDTPEREQQMGWIMVETDEGLVECTDPVYHPNQCRPSTYGQKLLSRTFLVLYRGQWMACVNPAKVDKRNGCLRVLQPREGQVPFRPSDNGPSARQ